MRTERSVEWARRWMRGWRAPNSRMVSMRSLVLLVRWYLRRGWEIIVFEKFFGTNFFTKKFSQPQKIALPA